MKKTTLTLIATLFSTSAFALPLKTADMLEKVYQNPTYQCTLNGCSFEAAEAVLRYGINDVVKIERIEFTNDIAEKCHWEVSIQPSRSASIVALTFIKGETILFASDGSPQGPVESCSYSDPR